MRYLLDTNVCIKFLNQTSESIIERLNAISDIDIVVCSVVKAELFYGAMKSNNPSKTLSRQQNFVNRFLSLPFDDSSALIYGRLRAILAKAGTPIGSNDLQIAAIAIANNLTLVTHNVAEFSRVVGLSWEDWEN
jgi:tRNA(fMet)-specific endonuclease VapC